MNSIIEVLEKVLVRLEREAEIETIYGFYIGGDPRRFTPDPEVSTPAEIAAHKDACEAWERGERPDTPHACEPLRKDITYTDKEGVEHVAKKGTGLALYAPFGMGIQAYVDEEAIELRDLVRAEIARLRGLS